MQTIRVWDLPTRLFHWLLAAAVVGLVITANIGGNWMNWHLRLGYAVLALLLFRVVWGFVGGHWSRFGSFLFAPSTVVSYLRGKTQPEHRVGHSPLGALSVFALLTVLLAQVGTGLMSDDEIAFFGPLVRFVSGDTVALATGYHKNVGKFIVIGLVVLHVLAVFFYKWVKKDNLIRPMVVGDKHVTRVANVPETRDSTSTRALALLVLALCGGAVTWLVRQGNAF
ncbi:cytochrome b/b6 domain-containing protein [Hydrogenophaga sp. PBL-H3]|uniref:cytochrome b/b6 domain-containing protein n=1 Tax=Hydrogenophaga sp. PBL-H3 TaxID=434010 RepID=UPI00131FA46B|nr:cytochrome b/b6 domain-containing protein [Hydrogenophaga sp. PBL-H3]QHE78083.1 cytochrome B [Hydrogenophaga sp. PBL-H3]QHE82508.1 cytochrome B [Hydrogenophaga sp. PBL-H3]